MAVVLSGNYEILLTF